jgi:hypothetical protein
MSLSEGPPYVLSEAAFQGIGRPTSIQVFVTPVRSYGLRFHASLYSATTYLTQIDLRMSSPCQSYLDLDCLHLALIVPGANIDFALYNGDTGTAPVDVPSRDTVSLSFTKPVTLRFREPGCTSLASTPSALHKSKLQQGNTLTRTHRAALAAQVGCMIVLAAAGIPLAP